MEKECPYCKKKIKYDIQQKFAGHCSICRERPGTKNMRLKQKRTKKLKLTKYILNCRKCKKEYIIEITENSYEKGNYKKHCSQSCANSHIQTKEQNKRRSELLRGKKNHNYKNGCVSTNNKIINEIFDKYNGKCNDCGKILFKGKRGQWSAHHLSIELKHKNWEKYMKSKDRVLLCLYCHNQRHKNIRNAGVIGESGIPLDC